MAYFKVSFSEICEAYPTNREQYLIKPVTGELSNSLECLSDIDEENPDKEQVITEIDNYAIKKTKKGENLEDTHLPTDPVGTIDQTIANFIIAIPNLLITYIKMLLGGIL